MLLARLGRFYAWASPDYLLWHMTIEQVFHFADLMIWMEGGKPPKMIADKPDLAKLYQTYGDQMKPAPGGGGNVLTR